MSQELKELQRRLEAIEDERRILETLHSYSHTIDYGPPEKWADVFTENGVFDVYRVTGAKTHREEGRGELVNYLSTKRLPPALYDKHLICSPVIKITGKVAKVKSYVILLRETEEDGPRVASWGRYHDTLVKQSNGKWLIKERLAEMETGVGRHFKKAWPSYLVLKPAS